MAFLDNSGDIILDAVLTDLGREKMAMGDFKIKYFALGDDEIDYSLYNKNHASGSAYYDLEILQTPILEAFTQTNAAINYGLLTTTATELLYMPVLKSNDKEYGTSVIQKPKTAGGGTIYWLSDPANDSVATNTIGAILDAQTTILKPGYLRGDSNTNYILIESGLDTTSVKGTSANTTTHLSQNGLIDEFYYVSYDTRFISVVNGADSATFSNDSTSGEPSISIASWRESKVTSLDLGLVNYVAGRIRGFRNEVYYSSNNSTDDATVSAIAGPRGNFTVITLSPKPDLGDAYSLYGATDSSGWLGSGIQFIDTTVYIKGACTGASIQLPIRIARANV